MHPGAGNPSGRETWQAHGHHQSVTSICLGRTENSVSWRTTALTTCMLLLTVLWPALAPAHEAGPVPSG